MINDNDLYSRLGDVASEMFFSYRIDTNRFEYLSDSIVNIFNLPSGFSQYPAKFMDLVHPDDLAYLKAQISAFGESGKIKAEVRITDANDLVKYFRLTAYAIPGNENLVAGWLMDVDNEKRNILYAEKINARKNSLLEILSHDLKEPVAMINMMATALSRDVKISGDQTLFSYIRVIQDLCDNNIKLIRNTVEQEFSEAGGIALRVERVDLVSAIADVMQRYEASASVIRKRFVFESSVPKLFVLADTLKIIQVINNLVSNAIKFTHDNGLISIKITDLETLVRITIADDGIGVPPELQPYLFEPHSRAQRPGVRGEEGTGIGLAIIRSLIELHGGRIWLDTQVAEGTTFHIELPKG